MQHGKAPQLLTHDDFYSEQHQLSYTQKGDVVTMDLGLQNGVKKTITLENGQLLVGGMQVAKASLSTENCQWLHESVLDTCAQSQSMGAECDDQYIYEPSMVQTRGLNEIRANPNFNEKAMTAACYQACQQKAAIPYSQFEVQVCGK